MKLIADSGSTKTAWYLLNQQQYTTFETIGYNPLVLSTKEMTASLEEELFPLLKRSKNSVKEIYFYGAGCSSTASKDRMESVLQAFFPNAKIRVRGDLWACIYATCGDQPGVCAILGTGSNACLYDGTTIVKQRPSLGYLLADEGGGVEIGKQLLRDFYYKIMPLHLQKAFSEKFENLQIDDFVESLYFNQRPNQYLASFVVFASQFRTEVYIQELLSSVFLKFIQIHLLHILPEREHPVHFVGTIASIFHHELEQILREKQFVVGTVLKTPFPKLVDYHQSTSN